MKNNVRTKTLSILLALAMLLSLVPTMSLTAYAATSWSSNLTFSSSRAYNDEIIVTKSITLNLNGCDVEANAGIYVQSGTLTITGEGKLYVYGKRASTNSMGHGIRGNVAVDGSRLVIYADDRGFGISGSLEVTGDSWVEIYGGYGGDPQPSGGGSNGGRGIRGSLTLNGPGTVEVYGGDGGDGEYGAGNKSGGTGGYAIDGNVTIGGGGYVHAIAGNGGDGTGDRGNGGNGGYGLIGTLTIASGSIMLDGGYAGSGYSSKAPCQAIYGTIYARVRQESSNGSSWTNISGDTSTLQYVKAEGHGHKFTYSTSGEKTITAVCSTGECSLPNNTGTLTLNQPKGSLVYNTLVREAVLTGAVDDITAAAVTYTKDGAAVDVSQVKDLGDYVATLTLGSEAVSVEFTITPCDYIVTIPARIDARIAGYNATDGITAGGTIDSATNLVVTASSANNWTLRNSGIGSVSYYLTTDEGGEEMTRWTFDEHEMAETTTKPMGAVIADYSKAPAGDYADTVTFTVSMEWK